MSEKWYEKGIEAEDQGGGEGLILWALGTIVLFIAVLSISLVLGLSRAHGADWYRSQPNPAAPVAKDGQCPGNYVSSSAYCNPSRHAPRCVPKQGQCPSGWPQSGNYCCEQAR